jgi:rubredoxin
MSKQKQWMCLNCGYVYRQELGDPDGGIAPGTPWEEIPDTWKCPDCAAAKSDFDMVEI